MRLTTEALAGEPALRAALYGPLVLAANLGPGPENGPLRIGGYDTATKGVGPPAEAPAAPAGDVADWIEVISAKDLAFRAGDARTPVAVKPLYRVTDERYACYWRENKA